VTFDLMNEQQQVMLSSVVVSPGQLQGASVIVQNAAAATVQGKIATITCYMEPLYSHHGVVRYDFFNIYINSKTN
jgi:hypothetical protein